MARRCELTGKGLLFGNKVSHSNRKTRCRWLPNLHQASISSDALGCTVNLRLSTRAIRTLNKTGLHQYLLSACDTKLSDEARRLKKRIKKRMEKAQPAA